MKLGLVPGQSAQHCTNIWLVAGANSPRCEWVRMKSTAAGCERDHHCVTGLLKLGQTAITDLTVSYHQIIGPLRLAKSSLELKLRHFAAGILKWSIKFFSHWNDNRKASSWLHEWLLWDVLKQYKAT